MLRDGVPSYAETLIITDAAVNIAPTLKDKVDIIQNAIDLAHALRFPEVRVALLSAMENGRRAVEQGRTNAFTPLLDFDVAVDFMLDTVHVWEDWSGCDQALSVRYEDLLIDYDTQVDRLITYLCLDRSNPSFRTVIDRYRPEQVNPDQKGLHFSQGKIGRFRQKMSPDQQQILTTALLPYLARMGYTQ